MFKIIFIPVTLIILTGCAVTQNTPYVDHEYGMAQNDAFDQQIAHKDYRYAKSEPAGMPGIHAEKIMDTYQNSFDRELSDDKQKNFSRGGISIGKSD